MTPQKRRALLRRGRQRGVSAVSNILECAMVMGWFVVLLLGEMSVSSATDARRYAETAADESASRSAASYCQPQNASVGTARTMPSVVQNGTPQVAAAIAMVQALGLGGERTFPNYVKPLLNVLVQSLSSAQEVPGEVNPAGKRFEGLRDLGCLEKPIDVPKGSMDQYRYKLWYQNLMGY